MTRDRSVPTRTRLLNYGLATLVVALPAMVLMYKWVAGV
jgi:hypothetical protein